MGDQLIAIAVLLPVVAGVLVFLIPSPLLRRVLVIGTALALGVTAISLAGYETLEANLPGIGLDWAQVLTGADLLLVVLILYLAVRTRHPLATGFAVVQALVVAYLKLGVGHHAAVQPTFALDRLSTTLSLIVSIVGSLIVVYSLRYMDEHEEHHHIARSRQPRFFFFLLLFLGAMNGLVFANDLGWLFLFWEITTLCSFMLIGHDGTPIALANATRALWMNLLGGIGFALGLLILALQGREPALTALLDGQAGGLVLLALALLTFAALTKSAQMPFQGWLLGAMVAPTPVSALLHSAAMVKAGVYLIVRLAPAYRGTELTYVVAFVGAFTFLVTAVLALTQTDGKRVLAYSTISNLGLIVTCAGLNTSLALAAAVMLILFHAVSKAMLFMCVGAIEHAIGSRDIDAMEGLALRHPRLGFITAVGIITMALPPAGMLISKWIAIEASAGVMPAIIFFLALGSAATIGFWARWLGRLFTSPPDVTRAETKLGLNYAVALLPLAVAAVVMSFAAGIIVDNFLEPGMRLYFSADAIREAGVSVVSTVGSFPIGWMFAIVVVGLGLPALAIAVKPSRVRPVYMCGENVGGLSGDEFYTVADQPNRLGIASSLYRGIFEEKAIVRYGNLVATLLLVVLLVVGYR